MNLKATQNMESCVDLFSVLLLVGFMTLVWISGKHAGLTKKVTTKTGSGHLPSCLYTEKSRYSTVQCTPTQPRFVCCIKRDSNEWSSHRMLNTTATERTKCCWWMCALWPFCADGRGKRLTVSLVNEKNPPPVSLHCLKINVILWLHKYSIPPIT